MAYKSKTELPEVSGSRMSYCTIDPELVAQGKQLPCRKHFHKEYADAFFNSAANQADSVSDIVVESVSVSLDDYNNVVEEKVKIERIVMPEPEMTVEEYLESLGESAVSILGTEAHHKEYAVIDFETTGGRPNSTDRAVQLAIIHVDENGNVTDRWTTFINPERPVEYTDVHGVTQEMADAAPTFKELAPEILSRLEGRVISAHNASYDLRFLRSEFGRIGMKMDVNPANTFCTMNTAKKFLGDSIPSTKLADCLEVTGLGYVEENGRGAHDASVDAVATAKLLGHYLQKDPERLYSERLLRVVKAEEAKVKAAKAKAKEKGE
jgi:DNA polymerase III epsilon subunit family exonuclease